MIRRDNCQFLLNLVKNALQLRQGIRHVNDWEKIYTQITITELFLNIFAWIFFHWINYKNSQWGSGDTFLLESQWGSGILLVDSSIATASLVFFLNSVASAFVSLNPIRYYITIGNIPDYFFGTYGNAYLIASNEYRNKHMWFCTEIHDKLPLTYCS